eukprot:scaffold6341_cov77-Skeletonema_marinoi.AAC.2
MFSPTPIWSWPRMDTGGGENLSIAFNNACRCKSMRNGNEDGLWLTSVGGKFYGQKFNPPSLRLPFTAVNGDLLSPNLPVQHSLEKESFITSFRSNTS